MDNTRYITIQSEKDILNRQNFIIQWEADNIGRNHNLTGYRGQLFFAVLDDYLQRFAAEGIPVVFIDKVLENPHIDKKTGLLK